MNGLIQSCYRVYFINQQNDLWALRTDGKLRFIKAVPAFAGISTSGAVVGVHFIDDKTVIQQTSTGFDDTVQNIMTHKGYAYYPAFCDKRPAHLALIHTDLLTPPGQGQLMIYTRARTKFRYIQQTNVAMAPVCWDKSGTLYFLSPHQDLIQQTNSTCQKIAENVTCFTLNHLGTALAYYSMDKVHLITLNPQYEQTFWATQVSALAFDSSGKGLYIATFDGTKAGLYFYLPPYHDTENFVVQNAGASPITLLFSPLF